MLLGFTIVKVYSSFAASLPLHLLFVCVAGSCVAPALLPVLIISLLLLLFLFLFFAAAVAAAFVPITPAPDPHASSRKQCTFIEQSMKTRLPKDPKSRPTPHTPPNLHGKNLAQILAVKNPLFAQIGPPVVRKY